MGEPPKPANSTNRAQQAAMYSRSAYSTTSTTSTSPPTPPFKPDVFGQPSAAGASAQIYGTSPTAERHPSDRKAGNMPSLMPSASDPLTSGMDLRHAPAVLIRKLPPTTDSAALNSMLLFAEELLQADFTHSLYPDDQGFAAAIAYFQTPAGALEAQQKLHGKPNATKEANMIVEAHNANAMGAFERRNTIDGLTSRTQTSSTSSASSGGGPPGRSRFNSAFHTGERISPSLPGSGTTGDFPLPENSAHYQNLFSPQSPLANGVNGSHRVSGKSVINDDNGDDEMLLIDPVAYAKSGQQPAGHRVTGPSVLAGHLGSPSLGGSADCSYNNLGGPVANGYTSPRPNRNQSIGSTAHPSSGQNVGQSTPYSSNYPKVQYPPVNPADQNPPCNTLYVGNLPVDTSEDELKSLFMKQRGYRRLCFRTKQNGPMCFVEFEDISFATKALNELYGHPLHNSVKGGIRLSFSKNPLGVRAGQTNGLGPNAVMSPQAMSPGFGAMSAVSGPPPGLGSPSSFLNSGGAVQYRSPPAGAMDSMFSNPFSAPSTDYMSQMATRTNFSGGVPPSLGNGTFGKDSRRSYSTSQQEQHQNGQSYNQPNTRSAGNEYQGQHTQHNDAMYQNGNDYLDGYHYQNYQNSR